MKASLQTRIAKLETRGGGGTACVNSLDCQTEEELNARIAAARQQVGPKGMIVVLCDPTSDAEPWRRPRRREFT